MKKEIITIKFKNPVKIAQIAEDYIEFTDGTRIEHYHKDDGAYEEVYAEWEALLDTAIVLETFKELTVYSKESLGIILGSYTVPCYNRQNGYYSNNLSVVITDPSGGTIALDVTGCTIDDIRDE